MDRRQGPSVTPLLANLLSDPLPVSGIGVVAGVAAGVAAAPAPSSAATPTPARRTMSRQPASPPRSTPPPGCAEPLGGGSRESVSYGRRRAVTACVVCRTRKTKCDNQRPVCGFCCATGGACSYPDDTAADHSKLDRGSLAILQRLGEMEQTLAALIGDGPLGRLSGAASTAPASTPGSRPSFFDDGLMAFDDPMTTTTTTTNTNTAATPDNRPPSSSDRPPAADVVTRSSEMRVENILQWPVFHTHAYPSLTATLGQDGAHMPFSVGDGVSDLDADLITQLVENFLATNHMKNPVFVVDQLWARVRDISETGLRWDGSTCLVLLICAVSVVSPPFSAEMQPGYSHRIDRLQRAEHYFQMAQRRIGMLHHTSSLLAVQCSFLTAIYLMATFRIMAAWKAFAQAGTQCVGWLASRGHTTGQSDAQAAASFQFPSTNSGIYAVEDAPRSDSEQHMEQSLYWSCLKSELHLGLPGSTLNEMQYSHTYPSPPSPEHLVSRYGHGQHERDRLERSWFFYLAEIALRRIMNDVLSSRYGAGSWYYAAPWWTAEGEGWLRGDVERFRQQLVTWQAMLPAAMRFPADEGAGGVTPAEPTGDALRGILRGHLVDILDVLYFPAVRAVVCCHRREDLGPYVLAAARDGLANAAYRIAICEEGFWHRHQGTWLMIRTCSRSLLQLLAVALRARDEPALAALLPDGWRYSAARVLALVEYWQHESADLRLLLVRLRAIIADLDSTSGLVGGGVAGDV